MLLYLLHHRHHNEALDIALEHIKAQPKSHTKTFGLSLEKFFI